jgi:hypothetical protein
MCRLDHRIRPACTPPGEVRSLCGLSRLILRVDAKNLRFATTGVSGTAIPHIAVENDQGLENQRNCFS